MHNAMADQMTKSTSFAWLTIVAGFSHSMERSPCQDSPKSSEICSLSRAQKVLTKSDLVYPRPVVSASF
jgi:hypothetical protein